MVEKLISPTGSIPKSLSSELLEWSCVIPSRAAHGSPIEIPPFPPLEKGSGGGILAKGARRIFGRGRRRMGLYFGNCQGGGFMDAHLSRRSFICGSALVGVGSLLGEPLSTSAAGAGEGVDLAAATGRDFFHAGGSGSVGGHWPFRSQGGQGGTAHQRPISESGNLRQSRDSSRRDQDVFRRRCQEHRGSQGLAAGLLAADPTRQAIRG